jgi:hypothetical protein
VRRIVHRIVTLVIAAVLLAACGDGGLLAGLGTRSQEVVYGDTSTTTTTAPPDEVSAPLGSTRASALVWFNDGIANEASGEASQVIAQVWSRGDGVTSVIQASRSEIAIALSGIEFPELVPEAVGWVTSQLVYDVASGTLATDTAAQFGLWNLEPYSSDSGRSALLWVRPARGSDTVGRVLSETSQDGLTLSWVAEAYHYEISCPKELAVDYCWQMQETMMPLSLLLPEG